MIQSEKPRQYVMTTGFDVHYIHPKPLAFIGLAMQIWKRFPVDMLVFENAPEQGFMVIKAHGYHADTGEFIDQQVLKIQSMDIRKFWLKYDDQGDFWLGTFLFPEEY